MSDRQGKAGKAKTRGTVSGTFMPLLVLGVMVGCFALVLGGSRAEAARSVESFIHTAAIGNQFEIDSSRIALQKSQNADVRAFAQQMINDHTKIGDDLNSAIAASASGMPAPGTTLDEKHQKIIDQLNAASGAGFDKAYVEAQVKSHEEAVALFDSYARNGRDQSLRRFAAQTLPTLENHKKDVVQLNASLK